MEPLITFSVLGDLAPGEGDPPTAAGLHVVQVGIAGRRGNRVKRVVNVDDPQPIPGPAEDF